MVKIFISNITALSAQIGSQEGRVVCARLYMKENYTPWWSYRVSRSGKVERKNTHQLVWEINGNNYFILTTDEKVAAICGIHVLLKVVFSFGKIWNIQLFWFPIEAMHDPLVLWCNTMKAINPWRRCFRLLFIHVVHFSLHQLFYRESNANVPTTNRAARGPEDRRLCVHKPRPLVILLRSVWIQCYSYDEHHLQWRAVPGYELQLLQANRDGRKYGNVLVRRWHNHWEGILCHRAVRL